jgi:hypothetical protein
MGKSFGFNPNTSRRHLQIFLCALCVLLWLNDRFEFVMIRAIHVKRYLRFSGLAPQDFFVNRLELPRHLRPGCRFGRQGQLWCGGVKLP